MLTEMSMKENLKIIYLKDGEYIGISMGLCIKGNGQLEKSTAEGS